MFFQCWKVSSPFSCHLEQDLNSLLRYGTFPLPTSQHDLLPHSPLLPPFYSLKRSSVTLTTLTPTFLWLESFPWPVTELTPSLLHISAQIWSCQRSFLLPYSKMHSHTSVLSLPFLTGSFFPVLTTLWYSFDYLFTDCMPSKTKRGGIYYHNCWNPSA